MTQSTLPQMIPCASKNCDGKVQHYDVLAFLRDKLKVRRAAYDAKHISTTLAPHWHCHKNKFGSKKGDRNTISVCWFYCTFFHTFSRKVKCNMQCS